MSELEVELEEPKQAKQGSVESDDANQSNAEELVVLMSNNNKHDNNYNNNDRQQLSKNISGRDHLDDGDVGVPTKHSGIPGATMNFVNSIIGAGIIGLPSALNKSGFLFGLVLMLVVAMMIDYGVRHLIQCGIKVRKTSYEETMQYAFGNRGFYAASAAIFGFAYGAMIVYHVVIGDTIPKIFQTLYPESILCNRPLVVVLYSIIFMLPLSLLKNMASLDKTSSLSFVCVIVIVFTVTIEGARISKYEDISKLEAQHFIINEQWFAGAGTMAFAFVCHHNSFVVFTSLKNPTQKRWTITTHASIIISVFWSMWLAIAGFFNFQTETQGDILNNFSYSNSAANYARGLLALTMVFTYPMELFVSRHSIMQCLKLNKTVNTRNENRFFYIITALLWGSSLLIGAFINDLGVVLEIVGVCCGAVVGFIFPGLVSLRIFGWNSLKNKMIESYKGTDSVTGRAYTCKEKYVAGWNFIFPIFMIVFGIVVAIMGLTEVFLNL